MEEKRETRERIKIGTKKEGRVSENREMWLWNGEKEKEKS